MKERKKERGESVAENSLLLALEQELKFPPKLLAKEDTRYPPAKMGVYRLLGISSSNFLIR